MFLKRVKVNYDFSFIYDIDWNIYEHDCLGHQQAELKDIHDEVGFSCISHSLQYYVLSKVF